jgi:peptidyl-prolyl cis-trans isomerase-like protein 2
MGKNHNKDSLYITAKEWQAEWGGKKVEGTRHAFKKLPFHCCALSLRPFEDPVCTAEGHCFDIANIVPYLKKNKRNPVTGLPLAAKELFPLHFHKNTDGEIICPILQKVFTDNSVIVAIKTSGHVYSKEAVTKLNFGTKNLHDLISGEAFTRADVITLQDPNDNARVRTIDKFVHQQQLKEEAEKDGSVTKAVGMKRVFDAVSEREAKRQAAAPPAQPRLVAAKPAARTAEEAMAHYSTGAASGSFTSTAVPIQTVNVRARKSEDAIREEFYATVKKKGYARLHTSHGNINIELHADLCPRACENFVEHALSGYYNGVIFHRNIPKFMIQGGDPTGTGRGGESIWEKTGEMPGYMSMPGEGGIGGVAKGTQWKKGNGRFQDEIRETLKHSGRGILSMANSGPNTNGSQFFITYAQVPHLNGKHTVFGRTVGGLEVLDKMEAVPTDDADRPKTPITIKKITIFVNPFEEARKANKAKTEKQAKEANEKAARAADPDAGRVGGWMKDGGRRAAAAPASSKGGGGGVGKYLNAAAFKH